MSAKGKVWLFRLGVAEVIGILLCIKAAVIAFGIATIEHNPYPAGDGAWLTFLISLGVLNGGLVLMGWILHPDA